MFAQITNGVVSDVSNTQADETWLPCGDMVTVGWTFTGNAFIRPAPTPPVLTPAQQAVVDAQNAISAGINLTSTATPSLNGTYGVGASNQLEINGLVTGIMVTGTFPNNSTTYLLHDKAGNAHTFPDVATFKNFAVAVLNFVAPISQYAASGGAVGSIPSNNITIP